MRVLLVSGSTRSGSANTAALVTAAALAPDGVTTALYQGLARLPAFNPDHDGDLLPDPVAGLRREIEGADAVLFCTPEYAGTLPGSLKNLLDWTVGGGELYGKPVAWLNVAAANRGLGAQQTLASVLGYVGAVVVEPACRHIPVDRSAIGPDGTVTDQRFAAGLADTWAELVRHAGSGGLLPRLREILPRFLPFCPTKKRYKSCLAITCGLLGPIACSAAHQTSSYRCTALRARLAITRGLLGPIACSAALSYACRAYRLPSTLPAKTLSWYTASPESTAPPVR